MRSSRPVSPGSTPEAHRASPQQATPTDPENHSPARRPAPVILKGTRHPTWPRSKGTDHSWGRARPGVLHRVTPTHPHLLEAAAAPPHTLCSSPALPKPRGHRQLQSQRLSSVPPAAEETLHSARGLHPGAGLRQNHQPPRKRTACTARTRALLLQFRAVRLILQVTLLKGSFVMLPPDFRQNARHRKLDIRFTYRKESNVC